MIALDPFAVREFRDEMDLMRQMRRDLERLADELLGRRFHRSLEEAREALALAAADFPDPPNVRVAPMHDTGRFAGCNAWEPQRIVFDVADLRRHYGAPRASVPARARRRVRVWER
jgi:hypothetical protein